MRSMFVGRPGPAALECAIDVWGRAAPVSAQTPLPIPEPPIDEDAVQAAAKRLGAAKRPLIVAGGGAQEASAEVTRLAHDLQAPVVSYRRGRGVVSDRDPLSVNLPLGREFWAEADVVLAVGTQLHSPLQHCGIDNDLAIVRVDADPEEPARFAKPAVALIGQAQPILQRLLDVLPAHNARRPSRSAELKERHARMDERLAKLEPQLSYLAAIRAELPEDGIFVDEVTQVGFVSRLAFPVYRPRTFLSPGYQDNLGWGFVPPRLARSTLAATCQCCRLPGTAAFCSRRARWPRHCAIAFRWSRCCSTTAPSATSAASRRRSTAIASLPATSPIRTSSPSPKASAPRRCG
jgi:acetolactate synthase-1/2/3 large subunit